MKNKESPRVKMTQEDIDLENKRLDRDIVSSFHEEVDMVPNGDLSMYDKEFVDWMNNRETSTYLKDAEEKE